jgi:hypothetical protein
MTTVIEYPLKGKAKERFIYGDRFEDNPHLAFVNIKRFHKAEPFPMPPPEGIIPAMCSAYERAIRRVYTWRSKVTHVSRDQLSFGEWA